MTNPYNNTLVDVAAVEKVFHRGAEEIHVLKDLHLRVPAGEFLALMGPSGSGKSTLLNLIGGLDRPTKGAVTIAGEQQRVGIARAIVTDPTLLLCDEPTGDLDRKAGDEILDLLQALNREHGKTIIMVTHDPHASARASRTVYLNKGQLSNEPEK